MAQTQNEYWNSEAAATWVAQAEALDAMLAPLGALAMARLGDVAGKAVLDVGCGAGATSRALSALGAHVTGIDVSAPLVEAARAKGGGPTFVLADAGAAPLPGPFAALFSRFGVMFFEDPVPAFTHLRAAMAPDAKLAFVCWGPMPLNAWASAPVMAVLPHLPAPPEPPAPGAPGPFAFAEEGRAVSLLTQAGWREARANLWQGDYVVGDTAESALPLMLKIGPLGRLLREHPQAAAPAGEALLALLKQHQTPAGVAFPAAVWIVEASA
jgi:SAM-dependent methyltransferase